MILFSLEFIARKTKVVTNEFSDERKMVCENVEKSKIETKFTRCSDAALLMFLFCVF